MVRFAGLEINVKRSVPTPVAIMRPQESAAAGDAGDFITELAGSAYVQPIDYETAAGLLATIDEMDLKVGEFSVALDQIAEATVVGLDSISRTFKLTVGEATPANLTDVANRILKNVMTASGLIDPVSMVRHVRTTAKYGNCYVQMCYRKGHTHRGLEMPVLEIRRHETPQGVLRDKAFTQERNNQVLGEFSPWNMVHMRSHVPNGRIYGRPPLLPAASIYNEYTFVSGLLLAERVHGRDLTVHHVDVTDIEGNKKDIAKRLAAVKRSYEMVRMMASDRVAGGIPPSDVYLARTYRQDDTGKQYEDLNKKERLVGRTSFEDQNEVLMHRYNRLLASLRVPPPMLGVSGWTFPQGYVDLAHGSFARMIRAFQMFASELVVVALHNEAWLNGVDPDDLSWELHWPNPVREDERMEAYNRFTLLRADQMMLDAEVITPRWVAWKRFGISPEKHDEMVEAYKKVLIPEEVDGGQEDAS